MQLFAKRSTTRRKRTTRIFSLVWASGEKAGRLEHRALTAPAFFRSTTGDLGRVRAGLGVPGIDWGDELGVWDAVEGETVALRTGIFQQYDSIVGGTNIQYSGYSASTWVDRPNPIGTPSPIGTTLISGTSSSQITGSFPGFMPRPFEARAETLGGGQYVVADTSPTPLGPITVIETFHATFLPSQSTVFTSDDAVVTLNTRSLALEVRGDEAGFYQVRTNGGLPTGHVSTTVYPAPGVAAAISTSAMSIDVTITTILAGGAPFVGTSNAPPLGIVWDVAVFTTHDLEYNGPGVPSPGAGGIATMTTSYEAHFYT